MKPGPHAVEIVRAAQVIEDAEFTTYHDFTHGCGGAPPITGLPSRQNELIPDFCLAVGMLVVVQPNVDGLVPTVSRDMPLPARRMRERADSAT